jgi:enamine deaminase RidA (YjgF/YER057c/UK114 family)
MSGAAQPRGPEGAASPHRLVNPDTLAPAIGFAHAVVPAAGRTVYLGGQIGCDAQGRVVGPGLVEQFDAALDNMVAALRAAGGAPHHLVSVVVYTTQVEDYRERLRELGLAHRRHLGKHYPAMALFGVSGLFDPDAVVELLGTAVVSEG